MQLTRLTRSSKFLSGGVAAAIYFAFAALAVCVTFSSASAQKGKNSGGDFAITISSNTASLNLTPLLSGGSTSVPFELNQELVIQVLLTGQKNQEYDLTISFPSLCSNVLGENRVLFTPDSTNDNTDIGVLAGVKIADLEGKVYYSYSYPGEGDQSPEMSATCNNNALNLLDPDFKINDKTSKDTLAVTLVYDVGGAVELSSSGVLSASGADGEPFNGVYSALFEVSSTATQASASSDTDSGGSNNKKG